MEQIIELIRPELLILIPILYWVGTIIKSSSVSDNKIPAILGVIGIVLSILYLFATTPISRVQDVAMLLFVSITQGALCAAGSVYANQLYLQSKKGE